MTKREKLIVGNAQNHLEEAKQIFATHKIEKLPLVDEEDKIIGLITSDDIKMSLNTRTHAWMNMAG